MACLEVRGLNFSYKEHQVLNDVNFSLDRGECLCIFGPNGCGKTTLLDCILCINKAPNGSVYLNDQKLDTLSQAQKARMMAYVSQKSERTFQYSALQMVLMGRTVYSGMFSSPGKEDEQLARLALKRVGMLRYADQAYTKLSGGEMQLVKIARAIAQDTDLIIFDEPTSHLDFRHELNVLKYIVRVVKERGVSVVIATHSANHAFYFENNGLPVRVAMMENGCFAALGIPSDVLNEANMERIFKVRTRMFSDEDECGSHRYLVPLDLSEEGDWIHEE